ncbi:MAG: ATP-binding protein [Armatimonadota bacterium]|nr:AAA family ATPase [Armatimonadota bacterium]MDW8025425.1 ATP-binding protein [Armatimonadota bacterium]
MSAHKLSAHEVRAVCDPCEFDFETTMELPSLSEIIGQPRATEALQFGVDIESFGYNIFALGLPGTGKMSFIKSMLEEVAKSKPTPDDWCYVYNFSEPHRPRALKLPAGMGNELKRDMEKLIEHLKREISRVFESEDYQRQRQEVINALQRERDEVVTALERRAREMGMAIIGTPAGPMPAPLIGNAIMTPEQFMQLPDPIKEQIEQHRRELLSEIQAVMRDLGKREREARQQLEELDKKVAALAVGHVISDMLEKYAEYEDVVDYLKQVQEDVINNVDAFRATAQQGGTQAHPLTAVIFDRYKVNVLVDNGSLKGAPVIVETNPTYYNLVGRIEYRLEMGAFITHFTMIKPGALHRANGGYLILDAKALLSNPFSWDALKRALNDRQIRLEEPGEAFRLISIVSLNPEPIPLNVKVVLVGSPWLYYLLQAFDEDFRGLFKVKADFDVVMEKTKENVRKYAMFIASRCADEKLKPFDKTAVAKVIEYSCRLVGDQRKLSTHFASICDLLREANYWASRNGHDFVTAEDVKMAIEKRIYRVNLIEERLLEMFKDGALLVDVDGEKVGTVNGLAILDLGDHIFGKPTRITARTFLGRGGIVNIEREVAMSGRIHSKAVMILAGYLRGKYAQDKPLSIGAQLTFEQLYDEIEGDSASAAELYALLSSISGVPIKQGIAVTGSVNQHGEIQPVGGVTYKVEGFFDVCKVKGLTGQQGVIIPAQNVHNLMLREDVVEAIERGQFHIWAIRSIDDGVNILMGIEAGERQPDGTYPEGTLHSLVEKRLTEMTELMRKLQQPGERRDGGNNGRD